MLSFTAMPEKRIKTDAILLRLDPDEKEKFLRAANKEGVSELTPWIRMRMRQIVSEILNEPYLPVKKKKK